MVKKKRRVIEIIEFKLKSGRDEDTFKKVSDKAQKFLEIQPGSEHRIILRKKDKNFYQDQVQWRNEDYAKIARKNSETAEEFEDYYNMISRASIKTTHPELIKMY